MDIPNELLKKIVERSCKIFMLRRVSKKIKTSIDSANFDIAIQLAKGFQCASSEELIVKFDSLNTWCNISVLCLKHSNIIRHNIIVPVILHILQKNTLKSLNLNGNYIGVNGVDEIIKALINTTLTSIYLANNFLTKTVADTIANELCKNSCRLVKLDLGDNRIGDDGALAIAKVLETNTTLEWLNLENNQIGKNGACAIAKGLANLTYLNLQHNNIVNIGTRAISNALKINTSLTSLNLGFNDIGQYGGYKIAEALSVNTSLVELYLMNNDIGQSGEDEESGVNGALAIAEALVEAFIVKRTRLSLINLRNNDIGKIGRRAFKKLKNTIKIMDVDSDCDSYSDSASDLEEDASASDLEEDVSASDLEEEEDANDLEEDAL